MEFFFGFLGIILSLGLGLVIWKLFFAIEAQNDTKTVEQMELERNALFEENARIKAENEVKGQKIGELSALLESERSEKNRLEGTGKQAYVEITSVKEENKTLRNEKEKLLEQLSKYEAEQARRAREHADMVSKLEEAKKSFEDEKIRVRREDEERQKQIAEEKDRIWNNHENEVIANLKEVCQNPSVGFQFYENTNLPEGFDGKIKPDFLVEFLGQYIVFDAKKSKDIRTYISTQVKNTAIKYKGNPQIYTTVFFVVPSQEIEELKELSFVEEGFSFFVIAPDAIEPILANFKRITEYARVEELDPQDRENIVQLIANYDRHISFQNAANILLAQNSISLMKGKESLHIDMQEEISLRKKSMRPLKLTESDMKKLSSSLEAQERDIKNLTSPSIPITKEDLENANSLF